MNKRILYILFLCLPVYIFAQGNEDTLTDPAAMAEEVLPDTIEQSDPPEVVYAEPVYTSRSFKPDFKKKYEDEDFVYVEKEAKKSLWQRFIDWLFSGSSKKQNRANYTWLGYLFRIAAFIIIGVVVYLIVRMILNKQGMWIFGRSRGKIGPDIEDDIAVNIHETDFKQLIEDTKATGNYRLALRYYYLWVLKMLSYREIIAWDRDKTNSDYLYEIKDNGLRRDFEYLSYVYDHSWYGDFPIDERAFAKAERSFKKTLNTL